jgi:two-component system CheB/CheR fusion protein
MAGKKRGEKRGSSAPERNPEEKAAAPAPIEEPAEPETGDGEPAKKGPAVVGIGASAGGLDAFKKFLAAMPRESDVALVLIPHLDPTHESLMAELLSRHTVMPVTEAEDGMQVAANRVYIIPPNKYMTISDGVLRLRGPVERRDAQTSIDMFLRSLAEDKQERAICVILSGTGSHGTLGLRAVKAAGGMAMVQEPKTAEYDRMPRSAIATGLADYVLPPEEMAAALVKYIEYLRENDGKTEEKAAAAPDYLNQVLALLRARTKYDFRSYRKRMLARRIERRMGLKHLDSLPSYLAFLRENADEVKQLTQDLFISVTCFFREPEALRALESEAIAPLVRDKDPDSTLRVWVAGCATGEEAYSIAMLLLEQLASAGSNCGVQVFATDVDEGALETARMGIYPESIAADVSPERLERFFTRLDESAYQVNSQLRECITFAVQNLISDPPFSKMDLVSCRNVLIYLEADIQQRIIPLLHFALNEGGYLFLGPSETIGRQIDLFATVSKKWRIFRRIGPNRMDRVDFPIVVRGEPVSHSPRLADAAAVKASRLADSVQRALLEEFAPAAVVINHNCEIVYYNGPTNDYLEMPTGEATHDLLKVARDGLRARLRSAVGRAIADNQAMSLSDAQVKRSGVYYPVAVTVKPLSIPRAAEGLLMVTFRDQAAGEPADQARAADEEPVVRQLEYELRATREDLQSTIEELESSNEELKGSNEEVMSMNEELQSANEELETSKEELQSLNEELTTVNNQLHEKVEELEGTSNDLTNLLNCTDIATVFLTTNFRVKRFTPASTRMFNLIATDIGRPISDIAQKFNDPDLFRDAERVLQELSKCDKEVPCDDGRCCMRRILPYRTVDHRIEGVVLTFTDITELKRSRTELEKEVERRTASLREKEERLRAVLNAPDDAIITIRHNGSIESVNPAAERMFGYSAAALIGQNVKMLMPAPYHTEHDDYLARYLRTGEKRIIGIGREVTARRSDGTLFPVDLAVSEVEQHDLFTGIIRDITVRKNLEKEVQDAAAEEQRRIGTDLHDQLGQELTALGLLADGLSRSVEQQSPDDAEIARKVARSAKALLGQIHVISRGLIAMELDASGLPAILQELASDLSTSSDVRCTFSFDPAIRLPGDISDGTARQLFLIAREACTNSLRHGKAKKIDIRLALDGPLIVLSIADDGVGIGDPLPEGVGLRIMRNRARIMQARLSFDRIEPQGTVVTCTVAKEHVHEQESAK